MNNSNVTIDCSELILIYYNAEDHELHAAESLNSLHEHQENVLEIEPQLGSVDPPPCPVDWMNNVQMNQVNKVK